MTKELTVFSPDHEIQPLLPDKTIEHGIYDTGDGNHVYYHVLGSEADDAPVIFLNHGGPGVPLGPNDFERFDLDNNKLVVIHQREAGNSYNVNVEDFLKNNTTEHLVEDTIAIADLLEIEEFHVAGGSWGSTLSLATAIAHPDRVQNIMVWGVTTLNDFDLDLMVGKKAREFAPDQFARLESLMPEGEEITNYKDMARVLLELVTDSGNEDQAKAAAAAFGAYQFKLAEPVDIEGSGLGGMYDLLNDPNTRNLSGVELFEKFEEQISGDLRRLAALALRYFAEDDITKDDYIHSNLRRLNDGKRRILILNGWRDMNTQYPGAVILYGNLLRLGVDASLNLVKNAGHSGSDTNLGDAIAATVPDLVAA